MLSKIFLFIEFATRVMKIIIEWRALEEKKKSIQDLKTKYEEAKKSGSTKELSKWLNKRL